MGLGPLGGEFQMGVSLTSHGQFIFQIQNGTTVGLNVGAAATASVQGGILWRDAKPGWDGTSSYVANLFAVDTFGAGGGGTLQFNGDGAQGGYSRPTAIRAGIDAGLGWGAFVGGGKLGGSQWASKSICD